MTRTARRRAFATTMMMMTNSRQPRVASYNRSAGWDVQGHGLGLGLVAVMLILIFTTAAPLAFASDPAQDARAPYALIFGTVWGVNDQPAYDVKVKIRRAGDKKTRYELVSNHRGEFAQRVPPGPMDYVITAEPPAGKNKASKGHNNVDVTVHVDRDERVDTALHLMQ